MANEPLLQKIESLLTNPLLAATKANGEMSMTQTQFMLNTCFTKEEKNGQEVYTPKMIVMQLEQSVITPGTPAIPKSEGQEAAAATEPKIEKFQTIFNLPLLTIIPLNSLAVQTVDVHVDLKNQFENTVDENAVKGNAVDDIMFVQDCKLHIQASQLPLANGVHTIIQAFTQSISPITLPND